MIWHTNPYAMNMVAQQTRTTLNQLLNLWHGDELSMGWASPTLAMHIARLTKPQHAADLVSKIYGLDRAGEICAPENHSPDDLQIRDIVRRGFKLYKDMG